MDMFENADMVNAMVTGLVSRFEGRFTNIKSIATTSPAIGFDYLRYITGKYFSHKVEKKLRI
jgi:hypothetical protein